MSGENQVSCKEMDHMESEQYMTGSMDRNTVIGLLRKEGFRITRQRELLIDIILEEKCTCCKEIYYLAAKKMTGIGMATIYRTITALEKIGALKRKSAYELCSCSRNQQERFQVELEDHSVVELDHTAMRKVLEKGLKQCGYSCSTQVKAIRQMIEAN